MSQREKRPHKRPKHLEEYVLGSVGTNKNSKTKRDLDEHSQGQDVKPAEIAMECSDENITFIPPKEDPKEVPNAGAAIDRGTPNEGVWNPENISSGIK